MIQSPALLAANASALESRVADLEKQIEALQAGGTQIGTQEKRSHNEPVTREWLSKEFVTSGNAKIKVGLSGHVNRVVLRADDGNRAYIRDSDNSASESQLRVTSSVQLDEGTSVGAKIEYGVVASDSWSVSQYTPVAGNSVGVRVGEVYYDNAGLGRVTLGHGSTSSDGLAEMSFSGTWQSDYSSVADLFAGFMFIDKATNTFSSKTIGGSFDNFDGGRLSRLRYDSPMMAGLKASFSYMAPHKWDAALTHSWSNDMFSTMAGVAYQKTHQSSYSSGWSTDKAKVTTGSLSLLHKDTGLNVTYNMGKKDDLIPATDNPKFGYWNLGWNTNLNSMGMTYFSLGRYKGEDVTGNGSESKTMAFAVTQKIDALASEVYAGYKKYELDEKAADYKDIKAMSFGVRVIF
jgi:hypothetical protein